MSYKNFLLGSVIGFSGAVIILSDSNLEKKVRGEESSIQQQPCPSGIGVVLENDLVIPYTGQNLEELKGHGPYQDVGMDSPIQKIRLSNGATIPIEKIKYLGFEWSENGSLFVDNELPKNMKPTYGEPALKNVELHVSTGLHYIVDSGNGFPTSEVRSGAQILQYPIPSGKEFYPENECKY